jgi:uncharacterized protein
MTGPVADPAVVATPAALEAIARLTEKSGPVMFFQSGGCCDGSLPMCFAEGEFLVGDHDVLLGHVGGMPFYIDHRQYEVWKHTQLILDVGEGEPEGFSLAAGEGRHFITRSRVCASPPSGAPSGAPSEPSPETTPGACST